MATFVVQRPLVSFISRTTVPPVQQKMTIRTEDGNLSYTVPFAPQAITLSGIAQSYATTDRPGRSPLVERSGQQNGQMSFSIFVGSRDPNRSVEAQLATLRSLARTSSRIVVSFNASESGLWRITDMTQASIQRKPGTNDITRAQVDITLVQASDAAVYVGPVSGGVKPPPKPPLPPAKTVRPPVRKPSPAPAPRVYTVVKGDNLSKIAIKFYRNASMWRKIADANHLRNANLIYPGQKLRIP